MRVLLTGGCGFIGANLAAKLARNGDHEVVVFDDESLGKRDHIADVDCTFISGDVRDRKALTKAMEGCDAVVHLAADISVVDSVADPRRNFDVNVVGTLNLLETMRETGVSRLVNASTGGAIGGDMPPPVREDIVPNPISPYGASKLATEGYCSAFAASYGLRPVSLRFSNVYGPRSHHHGSVIAEFFRRIRRDDTLVVYGDGEQTRDFVYVGDLCDGIEAALASDVGGVLQLGTGIPVSVNEMISEMRTIVAPHEVRVIHKPARKGEVVHSYCDVSLARSTIGFEPRTTLREGLRQSWSWLQGQNS